MELHKLRNSVAKDMKRQEVKDALNKCDNKVSMGKHFSVFFKKHFDFRLWNYIVRSF